MPPSEETIHIKIDNGLIPFTLISENPSSELWNLDATEASDNCEAPLQIKEGCTYQYELPKGYWLNGRSGIVTELKKHKYAGRITPGIHVGTLPLSIYRDNGEKAGDFALEVQSSKTSYRNDYRNMLRDITEQCTALLMQHSSPVIQSFIPDYNIDNPPS